MLDQQQEIIFRGWLEQHRGTVLKVARAYTQSHDECQDLAQEILLQVWRSLPQFEGRSQASTWSYRVALNTALAWRRREHRRRVRRQPVFDLDQAAAAGPAGSEQAAQRETLEQLYAAIRQLPEADAALVLLYLDDLSYRQMAQVLGISENHVGVKLNRAKKALGQLMNGQVHEP